MAMKSLVSLKWTMSTACYLHGLLAKQGFESLIRSFHFRSLFFDLGPIVKMELLVPTAKLNRVREIIRPESIEIV
jgi:hypothetical protein